MNINELVEYYKNTKSQLNQYKLAQLERQIWAGHETKNYEQRKWFADNFGGVQNEYEMRASLFSYGETGSPLWERMERGLSLYTAIKLMREAKKRAISQQIFLSKEVVQGVIADYDSKVLPKKLPKRLPIDSSTASARQLKSEVQNIVDKYISSFSNIDQYEAKQYYNELIELIDDAVSTINKKIWRRDNVSKINNLHIKIGRTNFIHALDVLGLKTTQFIFGKQIDLKKVKKAKVERLRYLHPDSNNGSRETETEFNNVNNAYSILEQYSEQI
jgi:hypothetical protein